METAIGGCGRRAAPIPATVHPPPVLAPPVAARQDGVFSRRQAREAGLSRWLITRRLADRTWTELLTDVYALAALPVTPRMRARAAALATHGVVSHASAAALHGLGIAAPERPHVITPRRIHPNVRGVVEHRLALDDADCMRLDGIPVTTRRRTIVDLLASSSHADAATLLFRSIQQSWITPDHLAAAVAERRGMTGTPQLRELLKLTATGAHSVAEHKLHEILQSTAGMPWRANVRVRLASGRSAVVDVLIEEVGLVIEVDGFRFHGADRFQDDRSRQNALVEAGYSVLRFTWADLVERPADVRRSVESQVARLRAAGSRSSA